MSQDKSQNRQRWLSHIASQEAGDQSQKAYCTAHNLNIHSLNYWRKILKNEKSSSESKAKFKSVKVTKDTVPQFSEYKVLLSSQVTLIFSGDFDLRKATGLIEMLSTRQC